MPITLHVAPATALVDEPVHIRLSSLPGPTSVSVRAKMDDSLHRQWVSHATFAVPADGEVDLSRHAPISGTYCGVDPAGLLWSMAPEPPGDRAFANRDLVPMTVCITAKVDGEASATATVTRALIAPEVRSEPVCDRGLGGKLFLPGSRGLHPGVIVLGGSGGGLHWSAEMAALLASRGYAALALAYFNYPGLPAEVAEYPLEYFETALGWLEDHCEVATGRLAAMGMSRGGELALLLGATFRQITCVVGYSSGCLVGRGIGRTSSTRSAWSYLGQPLPFATWQSEIDLYSDAQGSAENEAPIAMRAGFLRALADEAATCRAAIPVERINGPVLLVSGTDDQMWPASLYGQMVVQRLAAHGHPHPYEHIDYPGAGHIISWPGRPVTVNRGLHPVIGRVVLFGGNAHHQAVADRDSWAQVLRFLGAHLS